MPSTDFVVLGLTDVSGAIDVGRRLGWRAQPAPAPIREALHTDARCALLQHTAASVSLVVTPTPLPCRASGWWADARTVALDHLFSRFHTVLHSCETAEALAAALVARASASTPAPAA